MIYNDNLIKLLQGIIDSLLSRKEEPPDILIKLYDYCRTKVKADDFKVEDFQKLFDECKAKLLEMAAGGYITIGDPKQKDLFFRRITNLAVIIVKSKNLPKNYNNIVMKKMPVERFMSVYKIIYVGVANLEEREKNPSIKPIYQNRGDGLYMAVLLAGNIYAFVPRFGLQFDEFHFGSYGMSILFSCQGYQEGYVFSQIILESAAYFEFKENKIWHFWEKGKIKLESEKPKAKAAVIKPIAVVAKEPDKPQPKPTIVKKEPEKKEKSVFEQLADQVIKEVEEWKKLKAQTPKREFKKIYMINLDRLLYAIYLLERICDPATKQRLRNFKSAGLSLLEKTDSAIFIRLFRPISRPKYTNEDIIKQIRLTLESSRRDRFKPIVESEMKQCEHAREFFEALKEKSVYEPLKNLFDSCDHSLYLLQYELHNAIDAVAHEENFNELIERAKSSSQFADLWINLEQDQRFEYFVSELVKMVGAKRKEIMQVTNQLDEIKTLLIACNQMLERINRLHKEVEAKIEVLEEPRWKNPQYSELSYLETEFRIAYWDIKWMIDLLETLDVKRKKDTINRGLENSRRNNEIWKSLEAGMDPLEAASRLLTAVEEHIRIIEQHLTNLGSHDIPKGSLKVLIKKPNLEHGIPTFIIGKTIEFEAEVRDESNNIVNIDDNHTIRLEWKLVQFRDNSLNPEQIGQIGLEVEAIGKFRVGVSSPIPEKFTRGIARLDCELRQYVDVIHESNIIVKLEKEEFLRRGIDKKELVWVFNHNPNFFINYYNPVGLSIPEGWNILRDTSIKPAVYPFKPDNIYTSLLWGLYINQSIIFAVLHPTTFFGSYSSAEDYQYLAGLASRFFDGVDSIQGFKGKKFILIEPAVIEKKNEEWVLTRKGRISIK